MKRPRSRKVFIIGVLLLVAGGAIVNVAVASAIAKVFGSQYSVVPKRTDSTAMHTLHIYQLQGWPMTSICKEPRVEGMNFVPLWPGFAINTIFYAAILWGGWVVFFVPGILKRTLRRRRGQCPACAYPVGTSPICTECGKQVKM